MIIAVKSKINQVKDKIKLVFGHEPWWVEFWSGIAALFWAYVSYLSGDDVYYHTVFLELSILADATFWQILAVLVGLSQLIILIYNNYAARFVACFFASWFWAILTLAIAQSEPNPPGFALYASYMCINLVSMIKLARSHV